VDVQGAMGIRTADERGMPTFCADDTEIVQRDRTRGDALILSNLSQ